MRYQRSNAVVVAKADFIVCDGIVFIDDRNNAQFEKPQHCLTSMQVLLTIGEIVWDKKHLRTDCAMQGKFIVVALHEAALTNCGKRLQCRHITWPLG